jgi:hypothetical protein
MKRILIFLILISCNSDQDNNLSGIFFLHDINSRQFFMLKHGERQINIKVPSEQNKQYHNPKWFNTQNKVILNEIVYLNNGIERINLICFDIDNSKITRLMEVDSGKQISDAYVSYDDSLLVLVKSKLGEKLERGQLESIIFKNLSTDEILIEQEIDFDNIELYESPWSKSNEKICFIGKSNNETKKDGLYVYSINSRKYQLIRNKVEKAIWAPDGCNIAFLLEGSIYIYDLNSQKEIRKIYTNSRYERITDIHWTPDSKNIFMICPKKFFDSKLFYNYNEKLIDIQSGKVLSFIQPRLGYNQFTWK